MRIDFHCHVLPNMDDGAKDVAVSIQMLQALARQGVRRVAATPHFCAHREPVAGFLCRRARSLSALSAAISALAPRQALAMPEIHAGAEIRVEKGLSGCADLRALSPGGGGFLLLELPAGCFAAWMAQEIYDVAFHHSITPMVAHLDRYIETYTPQDFQQILSIPDVVIQLNDDSLFSRRSQAFALDLIGKGYPVVFGSDAHNLQSRPPNRGKAVKILSKKLLDRQYLELTRLGAKLLGSQ